MATHSSVLAWRIPGMGEPGGLPSLGSHRVGHDWSDLAAAAACGYLFGIFSWGQQNITSGLVYCDYISDPYVHTGQITTSVVSLSTREERSWWDWRMREGNPDYCIAFLLFQKIFIEIYIYAEKNSYSVYSVFFFFCKLWYILNFAITSSDLSHSSRSCLCWLFRGSHYWLQWI